MDVERKSKLSSHDEGTGARSKRHINRIETAASAQVDSVYQKARDDLEDELTDRDRELHEFNAEKYSLQFKEMDTQLRQLQETVGMAQEVALSEHQERVEVEEHLEATRVAPSMLAKLFCVASSEMHASRRNLRSSYNCKRKKRNYPQA